MTNISIISNQSALFARENLSTRNQAVIDSTSRLSSGVRVLGAEDDAAAVAVNNNLAMQISSLRQAQINATTGNSMAQTADGALGEVDSILARMKALATQTASGQLSDTERTLVNYEYQGLLTEIDRIAADTKFNGVGLLSGQSTSVAADTALAASQVEAADGFSVISFQDDVGDGVYSIDYVASTRTMTATNMQTGASSSIVLQSATIGAGDTEEVLFGGMKVRVTLDSNFDKTTDITSTNTSVDVGTGAINAGTITLDSMTLAFGTDAFDFSAIDATDIAVDATTASASTFSISFGTPATAFSGTADLTGTGSTTVTLSDAVGNSFDVSFDIGTGFVNGDSSTITMNSFTQVITSTETTSASASFSFQMGSSTDVSDVVTLVVPSVTATTLGLDTTTLTTRLDALNASDAIDNALTTLNESRARIGAVQQRFEFAAATVSTTVDNMVSAQSALVDVDVSSEITELSQNQAMMEASISVLAQANTIPQIILGLLRN